MTHAQIKARRLALGLTQTELARRAGVSRSTIVRLERGDRASYIGSVRRSLADALEISVEEIFAGGANV